MGDIEVKDGEPADVSLLKFSTAAYEGGLDLKMNPTTLHEVPFNYRAFHQLSIHLETTRGKSKCRIVVRVSRFRTYFQVSALRVLKPTVSIYYFVISIPNSELGSSRAGFSNVLHHLTRRERETDNRGNEGTR